MRHLAKLSLASCLSLGTIIAACAADVQPRSLDHAAPALDNVPLIASSVDTPPLHGYDDAPRAVDSDDPAIWVHPTIPAKSLVIGALKDAGLQVYDLDGKVLQTIVPPNRSPVSAADPQVPGPQPDPGTTACPESTSGETFGRYNNVDVQYGVRVGDGNRSRRVDLAVVTDRGCDRLRFYTIDATRADGPLIDITSPSVPRVFPKRFVQPSPYQPVADGASGVRDNPVDDQSTAYGLALYHPSNDGSLRAFVTQRSRSVVAELQIVAAQGGTLSYRRVREYRFPAVFELPGARNARGTLWSPCRDDPTEDPQLEGLVVDQESGTLFAGQEPIGVWQLTPADYSSEVVNVSPNALIEKTKSFGQAYWAIPDDDEFSCEAPEGTPPAGAIVVAGNPSVAGANLQADVEGLAIYYGGKDKDRGYLIVSSQGDDTFHIYSRKSPRKHFGTFQIDGTGETDGHEVVNVPVGRAFPSGLFVAQNGDATPPASTDPVNGYDYDNSTQFRLLDWADIATALHLTIDTTSYNPRGSR